MRDENEKFAYECFYFKRKCIQPFMEKHNTELNVWHRAEIEDLVFELQKILNKKHDSHVIDISHIWRERR